MSSNTEGYPSNALRGDQSFGSLPTTDNVHGGGLYNSNTKNPTIEDYENIFGPAARDIKQDPERHRRRQRWHLPDALKGPNPWLADRIDGLITDTTNSPFTTYLLPYKHIDNVDGKIQWNVWSFDEGMASRVPYESSARVLTQTKRSFAGYTVRQGLAIVMEANFMMSEAGQKNFRDQLSQVVHSIQYSNNFDVTMALIQAPSYEKHFNEKYPADPSKPPIQKIRDYVDMFGYMQKTPNALDMCIEDSKATLRSWGSKDPDFLLCNSKLTMQLQMHPERTQYFTQGEDGVRRLKEGPNINRYRGLKVINTHSFSTETGTRPRDLLARRVRVGEYYRFVPPHGKSVFDCQASLYNEQRDTWDYIDFNAHFQNCKEKDEGNQDPDEKKKKDYPLCEVLSAFFISMTEQFDYNAFVDSTNRNTNIKYEDNILGCILKMLLWDKDGKKIHTTYNHVDERVDTILPVFENTKHRFESYAAFYDTKEWTDFLQDQEDKYNLVVLEILETQREDAYMMLGVQNAKTLLVPHLKQQNIDLDELTVKKLSFYISLKLILFLLKNLCKNTTGGEDGLTFKKIEEITYEWNKWTNTVDIINELPRHLQPYEILLLRPNIEHQMFGIIMGKSGLDDLGATLWGQTQLECYSDSVHGIWGMSYKYNERAIVFNEKNLIRIWDIAYGAYCGGKGTDVVNESNREEFRRNTVDNSRVYTGPDILFIPINHFLNRKKDNYPSPSRFFTNDNECEKEGITTTSILPDQEFDIGNIAAINITMQPGFKWVSECIRTLTEQTHLNKNIQENSQDNSTSCTGGVFFEGSSKCCYKDSQCPIEIQGSGHHGPDFIGVASKRNGKGMKTAFSQNSVGVFAAT